MFGHNTLNIRYLFSEQQTLDKTFIPWLLNDFICWLNFNLGCFICFLFHVEGLGKDLSLLYICFPFILSVQVLPRYHVSNQKVINPSYRST